MSIRAIVFDFGGVLMRTEDHSGRIKWEARLGLPRFGLERMVFGSDVAVRGMRGEVSMDASWQHVAATFQLNPDETEELQRDFFAGDRLDPILVVFLRGLRPRLKTAILSNAWANARELFTQLGLHEVTDVIVISAEEGLTKPDPRIYQLTLDRLGTQPAETIFVDDFVENVEGARALGMHSVHFRDTEQVIDEINALLERL